MIYKTFLVRSIYITKDPFFRKNAYDRTASMHNNDNIYARTKPQNNSFKKWYYSLMLIRPVIMWIHSITKVWLTFVEEKWRFKIHLSKCQIHQSKSWKMTLKNTIDTITYKEGNPLLHSPHPPPLYLQPWVYLWGLMVFDWLPHH